MYLSDHSKNLISAEEKVAELIKQRDQLSGEVEQLKHGTVAQFKDAFIDLRASSDEHAKGYVESRKRIAAMESEIDRLHAKNAVLESATARAERAEAEVERLTAQRENLLKPMRDQAIARADRAEAELATERARLDWLEKQDGGFCHIKWGEYQNYWGPAFPTKLRAAIDAAMKEGTK